MSRKGNMPETLFVSPVGDYREKKRHTRVMMVIEEWDADGRPKRASFVHEEGPVALEDVCQRGGEFISAYVMDAMLEPQQQNAGKKIL